MNKNFLYIASWKAYLTYDQELAWYRQHAQALKEFSVPLVLCPSFLTLAAAHTFLSPEILVGAQDCSAFKKGAHTGDIPAESLKQAGAHYCIIGHSERRQLLLETSETIAEKMCRLIEVGITPIICLSDEYAIELPPIIETLMTLEPTQLIIVYEPISAIGTGIPALPTRIEEVSLLLKQEFVLATQNKADIRILYGGGITAQNCNELKQIRTLDGFLIGSASTDFQELKKIVQ